MIILIDTREQKPLIFSHQSIEGIEFKKLEVGDYGVRFKDNSNPEIYFERKSIADLFSTLTSGYKRFKKELIRSQEQKKQLILAIEGTASKVLSGTKHSSVSGETILTTIHTLWIRHGIQPIFCKDRADMVLRITHFYCAIGRESLIKKGEK